MIPGVLTIRSFHLAAWAPYRSTEFPAQAFWSVPTAG
jgi:hypothetical protein